MNMRILQRVGLLFALAVCSRGIAMEIAWTRTTGQYPVECTPVVARIGDGDVVLALNRGGQIMAWNTDGSDWGDGQDGTVAQLPEGFWSATPLVRNPADTPFVVACSGEGLVIALDASFRSLWQVQLPGKTVYGEAIPVAFPSAKDGDPGFCISDKSGTVTCLNVDGSIRWQKDLGHGSCRTPLRLAKGETPALLVAAGNTLSLLVEDGAEIWARDLGVEITAGPVNHGAAESAFYICGGGGLLIAVDRNGEVLWRTPAGEEMDTTIATASPPAGGPIIVSKGLWGNLYAFTDKGERLWTHEFRAKSRSASTFVNVGGSVSNAILSTSYDQQARLFNDQGELLDTCRLAGAVNGSPVGFIDIESGEPRCLVVTASLLAHCLKLGPMTSPYAIDGDEGEVKLTWRATTTDDPQHSLIVDNPGGRLLRVNLSVPVKVGGPRVYGTVTTQSAFEIPFDTTDYPAPEPIRAIVHDAEGHDVCKSAWSTPGGDGSVRYDPGGDQLIAWAVPAYGHFNPGVLAPQLSPNGDLRRDAVEVSNLYVNEIDEAALILVSTFAKPVRVRINAHDLKDGQDSAFGGAVNLFEVVFTGASNGEDVADALNSLGDSGLHTLLPGRATKIWVQVDAHGATPGSYAGTITVQPILEESPAVELGLSVSVPNLTLEAPLPLTLCTWDYVPNQWFPNRTPEVLDDMNRHGVTVFPRSIGIPKATVDASGTLQCDWSAMDAPLAELKGRGEVLFQMTAPPIAFENAPDANAELQIQITYLQQWRDHLRELGWGYEDFALYPIDEPGLANGKRIQTFLDAANLFRAADPRLRIYTDPVPGLSMADFDRISPYVDVWCPNMRLVSGLLAQDPRIQRIKDSGKVVWSYECVAQVRSLSPLRYNRANAWRGHAFGLQGIGFWTHCTTQTDPWLRAKDFNEYELVYPGALPVPSVRWEAVRDGLEDVAAIAMLERAIASAKDVGVKADVVAAAEKELRIAQNDIMELSDDAFKESRDYLKQGDRRIWHTPTDVETYARHRKRIAELTLALQD